LSIKDPEPGSVISVVAFRIAFGALLMLGIASCGAAQVSPSARASAKVAPLATSEACSPRPCALVNGLQINISDLERDAPRPSGGLTPPADTHYVRLRVSFLAAAGDHSVLDPRSFTPSLIDEGGPDSMTSGGPEASFSYQLANPDNYCGAAPPSLGPGGGNPAPPLAQLKSGQRFGPLQLCYWVRGPVSQHLTFAWVPFNWPDTPGVIYKPVEIAL